PIERACMLADAASSPASSDLSSSDLYGHGGGDMSVFMARDSVETVVAAQWSRVLGAAPADLNTDFFDVGGDSIRARLLALAIGEAFGTPVPLDAIFERPTVKALSEAVRRSDTAGTRRSHIFRTVGKGAPLVILPTGTGNLVGLQHLGADH